MMNEESLKNWEQENIELLTSREMGEWLHRRDMNARPQDCSDCKRYDSPYFEIKIDKEQLQELVDKAKAEVLANIERPQGEWIPVSERLPEENGEYLVTREAYIDRENRNMIFVRDIASFTVDYGLNNGFHKANTVIAWQPLPEPYKKGGAENE